MRGENNSSNTNQLSFDELDKQNMSKLATQPIQPGTHTTVGAVSDKDNNRSHMYGGNDFMQDRVDEGSNESFPSSDAPASQRSI